MIDEFLAIPRYVIGNSRFEHLSLFRNPSHGLARMQLARYTRTMIIKL